MLFEFSGDCLFFVYIKITENLFYFKRRTLNITAQTRNRQESLLQIKIMKPHFQKQNKSQNTRINNSCTDRRGTYSDYQVLSTILKYEHMPSKSVIKSEISICQSSLRFSNFSFNLINYYLLSSEDLKVLSRMKKNQ